MAKFCTKCGKKLEDGQVCDCEKKKTGAKAAKTEEKVVAQAETAPATGIDFNWYANSYLDIIKGLFTKPIDTIKKYATSKNLGLGIASMVIACIVMGIFQYCLATEGTVSIIKAVGDMAGVPLGGLSSSSLSAFGFQVDFIKTFLQGFVTSAATLAMMALMIYVFAGAIFKSDMDIRKAFALVGVVAVYNTIIMLVTTIFMYISGWLMLIVLLVGSLFYAIYLLQGIVAASNLDHNRLALVYVPAVVVTLIVVIYVLPKLFA